MKKIISFILFGLLTVQLSAAKYDNDRIIDKTNLPVAAQKFLNQHFASDAIAIVKQDTEIMSTSYDVIFDNGNKIEFDKKGNWESVDCRFTEVPKAIIPNNIQLFVTKKYPNAKVLKINKEDRGEYEVTMSNSLELTFDSKGRLVDIDND